MPGALPVIQKPQEREILKCRNCTLQALKCLKKRCARATHIHSHKAHSSGAKHCAVVKRKTSPLHKEFYEPLVGEPQGATIQPNQKLGLRAQWFNIGKLLFTIREQKLYIPLHIGEHLPAPLLTLFKCSNCCNWREERCLIQFIGL